MTLSKGYLIPQLQLSNCFPSLRMQSQALTVRPSRADLPQPASQQAMALSPSGLRAGTLQLPLPLDPLSETCPSYQDAPAQSSHSSEPMLYPTSTDLHHPIWLALRA